MKTAFVIASAGLSMVVWACSADDGAAPFVPAPDVVANTPATEPSAPIASRGDAGTVSASEVDSGFDAAFLDIADASTVDASDAGADESLPEAGDCTQEIEPNDEAFHQLPRRLCGTLTATDVDRFYIEGRKDQPIEVRFAADEDAMVLFRTNAGLAEDFVGKAFVTTLKPGDRKLLIEVSGSKGTQGYRLGFDRK